jgi:hypothetical protein
MYGTRGHRWDGIRLFGRPPVLAPPDWALTERIWQATGLWQDGGATRGDGLHALHGEPRGSSADPTHDPVQDPVHDPVQVRLAVEVDRLVAAVPVGTRRIVLVVPDGTRVGPWRELLPHVLTAIATAVPRGRREALGRHLLPTDPEPSKTLEAWAVIQNGGNQFRDHIAVGRTPAGTPIRLHPAYVEADWRILLGEISWHYFAGFGGGRKLVFPGLGEPVGIAENHRRAIVLPEDAALDPGEVGIERVRWQERCGPGRLVGNPVHEDLEAAVALAPPHWVLTAVDDPPPDLDPARPKRSSGHTAWVSRQRRESC